MDETYRVYHLDSKENVQRFISVAQGEGYELGEIDFSLDDITPSMRCHSLHDPRVPCGGDSGIIRGDVLFVDTSDGSKPTRLDEIAKAFKL